MRRSLDLIISIMILIPIIALIPIWYLIHRRITKSPFIFEQVRVGKNGKPFICFKVRSIYDFEAIPERHLFTALTYSRFIRKYRFDELPQLINVLIGDMSLVGPRPLMPSEVASYYEIDKNVFTRHKVMPGMTGISQICINESGGKSANLIAQKIEYDLRYCNDNSLRNDVRIIYYTILYLITQRVLDGSLILPQTNLYLNADISDKKPETIQAGQ
jgi:putative colanic acid biosynthesis UDP-glucose lipid carrier transferase